MRAWKISMVAATIGLAGCAYNYKPPATAAANSVIQIKKSKTEILAAARRTLVGLGYQITAFDDSAGIVSTAPRDQHVTPEQADCGTTMGIDYLLDVRTKTRVAIGIIGDDGKLEVKANIEGEYKPGSAVQNITLTCVSRGPIEQEIVAAIVKGF